VDEAIALPSDYAEKPNHKGFAIQNLKFLLKSLLKLGNPRTQRQLLLNRTPTLPNKPGNPSNALAELFAQSKME
jgi:hypothetical protein